MFFKFFGIEIKTERASYGLGKYAKDILIRLNGKELHLSLK